MPLDISRFRRSALYSTRVDAAFSAGFLLMCASWHSTPAASLRDDDCLLAYYAGYGPAVHRWKRIRDRALADWTRCSDGRLYHPDVAQVANEAWLSELMKAGRRTLRDGEPIGSIAADIEGTLYLLDWQQPSRTATRAAAWLRRHCPRDSVAARRVSAGRHALKLLEGNGQ